MFGPPSALKNLLVGACLVLCATGCTKAAPPPPGPPRIALLGDVGGFTAGSFGARAASGLAACAGVTGAQISEAVPTSTADIESQLALLATENFDTVIALGSASIDLGTVARRFETSHFAVIDGFVPSPNVTSIGFKEQEGSFLAGALAASVSRTKRVAFLGGLDIPRLYAAESGFDAGVREIDPRVRIDHAFVGSFLDEAAGAARAKTLYAAGADVAYVVAGRAGLGAIAATKDAPGRYAIGVDSDQDALAPGKVLASVVKRVDRAAAGVCLQIASQKPSTGRLELGLADGGHRFERLPPLEVGCRVSHHRPPRPASRRRSYPAGSSRPPPPANSQASAESPFCNRTCPAVEMVRESEPGASGRGPPPIFNRIC